MEAQCPKRRWTSETATWLPRASVFFCEFRLSWDLAGAIASDTLNRTALEVPWFQLAACHVDHVVMEQHLPMLDSKLAKLSNGFTWFYQYCAM